MDKSTQAEVLGQNAFKSGASGIPACDRELIRLLAGIKAGEAEPIIKAWVNGWTSANLAAPVIFND